MQRSRHMQPSFFLQPPLGAAHRATSRLRATIRLAALGLTALLILGLISPAAHAQDYNQNTLYSFTSNPDGANPFADLINVNGTLYGTTREGGTNTGSGTIFSYVLTSNIETPLYSFTGQDLPQSGLLDVGGILYGTGTDGGTSGDGDLFSFDPTTNTETTLHTFTNTNGDGSQGHGDLIDVNGILYGTTASGGAEGSGTIFSFDPSTNAYNTAYSFSGGADGGGVYGSLVDVNGILYGNTNYTIFSFDPTTNIETPLYGFPSNRTGANGGMVAVNGILYGTTGGGGSDGLGSVFSFDPTSNTETTLYSFTGTNGDGQYPTTSLIYDSATKLLFGTTSSGGDSNSDGTVFSFNPTSQAVKIVYTFQGASMNDGATPDAGLLDINGTLYGTTYLGGANSGGTIYSLTPTTFTLPKTGNDKYTVRYNNTFAIKAPGVMGNDNVGGSNRTTATLVTNVTHGTLTFNSNGSFTYVPPTGFVGTDTFTYYDTNPLGKSNTGTVTLAVTAEVPIAYNDGYGPKYNTTYSVRNPGVLANDYTGENVTLTATLVTSASHGTLSFHSDGSFVYKPNLGFAGTDTFTYYATNPIGNSNTATVSLIVSPTNPIAYNDTYTVKYQTAYAVKAPGVLANDDTGGVTPLTATLVNSPTHGTLTFNSDGSFTYKPNPGFTGTDSFTYYDTNSVGTGNTATVTLNVPATAPIAANDAYSVKHNTAFHVNAPGVLANDGTGGSTPLTASLVTGVTHGTLTFNSDGSFTYTPTTGYSGVDTFTYTASNSVGTSNTATVTLNVQ